MKIDKTEAQMRKGILELVILSIISEKEAYPSDIIKKLKKLELIVVEGTLYPLLSRLKNTGLLEYNWRESSTGPPRKYYYLTDEGRLFVKELYTSWSKLVKSVEMATVKLDVS